MIKYTKGWKYVLAEDASFSTGIYPPCRINHKYEFTLDVNGDLYVYKSYPWDGASGGFDTENSITPSLVHDCFCEMMRTGELNYDYYSDAVHELLGNMCRERGMTRIRSDAWKAATKFFRGGHPSHPDEHPILTAP